MQKILSQKFFHKPTISIAKKLLGKFLVRRLPRNSASGQRESARYKVAMITEVEAYSGTNDSSSHAFRGITPRTKAMFGKPGHWYIYLIYGMYHCLNLVTEAEGTPGAVLIRGVAAPEESRSRHRREGLISGPGKLCREFKVDLTLYGKQAHPKSGLWIEDRGLDFKKLGYRIQKTPRMNIGGDTKAKERLWRFVLIKERLYNTNNSNKEFRGLY